MTIKVSVIGATGYAGAELVRNLLDHPQVELKYLASKTYEGQRFSDIYPNIHNCDMVLSPMQIADIAQESEVVFCCLPHGLSAKVSAALLEHDIRVIDLSGDLRYDDEQVYEQWYNTKHEFPDIMKEAVYGLSEIYHDEIKDARVVANPGCYTTCAITSLYPVVKEGIINKTGIIIDAKSGVSGAGRGAKTPLQFCEVDENIKAYGLTTHRHTSEIEQELSKACNEHVTLSFTPHLIPVKRGILSTCYANLNENVTDAEIQTAYEKYYANCPFVHFTGQIMPETKHVQGSNRLDIGYKVDKRLNRIIIVSVLDNLIKGAGGQAIQNMNIMFGINQNTGLKINGLYL